MTDLTTPDGPGLPMYYRQGHVIEWNPITLENRVRVGNTVFQNLTVLGVGEATLIRAGSVVSVVTAGSTWGILGRQVIPGTPDATDAITLLSSRTKTDIVNVQETTNSTSFTDLATVGPAVTVDIGASGRALMVLSAKGGWSVTAADPASGARMSAALSGANTLVASTTWAAWTYSQFGGTTFSVADASITSAYVFEGLNAGPTTFTAKYRSDTTGVTVDFNRRTIVVIAL